MNKIVFPPIALLLGFSLALAASGPAAPSQAAPQRKQRKQLNQRQALCEEIQPRTLKVVAETR
jgi:hypothetical protein